MRKQHLWICLFVAAGIAGSASAQQTEPAKPSGTPEAKPGADDKRRQMARMSPEERKKKEEDRMVQILAGTYKLTAEQQQQIRSEVEKINEDYRKEMGPTLREMEKVEHEMGRMYQDWLNKQQATGKPQPKPWEDPKFITLQDRLRVLKQSNQLDWSKTLERIEKMLPAPQVELAHAQRQEWIRRLKQANASPSVSETAGISSWEEYAKRFSTQYAFDAGQQNAVRAVLKDVQDRAQPIRRAREGVLQSLQTGTLTEGQTQQLTALNDQIESLFTELKNRLEGLVTAQQRQKANEPSTPPPATPR